VARNGGSAIQPNRLGSDGDIVAFRKDGSVVASIGSTNFNGSKPYIANPQTNGAGLGLYTNAIFPTNSSGAPNNGVVDLGIATYYKFKDLHLSGTINKTAGLGTFAIETSGSSSVNLNASNSMKFTVGNTDSHQFINGTTTAMTLDESGNLLVGKTSTGSSSVGSEMRDGTSGYTATFTGNDAANSVLSIMRNNGDGELIRLRNSSGNPVGTISTYSDGIVVGNSRSSSYANLRYTNDQVFPCTSTGGTNDNAIDLGKSTSRFQDLYLSGGVFLGGTGSSNKLNDYEEGTWTPTFGGDTTNPTITYSYRNGDYTKVGRIVHVRLHIEIFGTASGGGGGLYIGGLPFTSANDGYVAGTVSYVSGWDTDAAPTMCLVNPNTTKIPLYFSSSSDPRNNSTRAQVSHLGTNTQIYLAVSYNV